MRAARLRTKLPTASWLVLAILLPILGAPPIARARCARPAVAAEARRSHYVFEGTLESVSGLELTFRVTAAWKGAPPERVRVSRSGRDWGYRDADIGRPFLVFAVGDGDSSLSFSRCGSTGLLEGSAATIASLAEAGLTRSSR